MEWHKLLMFKISFISDEESICSNQEGCDEPSSDNEDKSNGSECGCNKSRMDKNEQKRAFDTDKVHNVIIFFISTT